MNRTIFITLVITIIAFSQEISNWQNYTNMQVVNDFVISNDIYWAATDGGVYAYYKSDSTYLQLTKSEGLSSHSTTAIAVDTSDFIWIGTSDGYINVYDPTTNTMRTIYDIAKTNESNKYINGIYINNDTAFVATEFGLILFNTNDLSVFDSILKFGEFNSKTAVKSILHGYPIYALTEAGIAKGKLGFENLQAPEAWDNLPSPSVETIFSLVKFNNSIHVGTDRGIYIFNGDGWDTAPFTIQEKVRFLKVVNNELYGLSGETKDGVWTSGKLYRFSPSFELLASSSSLYYTKIDFDKNDLILSSSVGIRNNGFTSTENFDINPNSPATNTIVQLTVDFDGNLWSSTGKNGKGIGVLKFDGQTWENIDRTNNTVFSTDDFHFVSSSDKSVYLSTWGEGFVRLKDGIYESFNADNTSMFGIPSNNKFLVINEIAEDSKGNAWITNYWSADRKPLSVLTPEGDIFNYQVSGSQFINVRNLVVDAYDTKWFSGDLGGDEPTDGLYFYNENGTLENTSDDDWGKLTESNGLRNRDVKALAIDNFGELIIGTSVGIDVISNPSNPSSIRGDQYFALRQQTINCIAVDPINQKWIGTEKGIFLTNSDGSLLMENFTKANSPLPSDVINTIAIDSKNGIVYAGTDFGITAIKTLYIQPNNKFDDIYVYPNPLILDEVNEAKIVIDGLIEDSEIKILDISGSLINQFRSIGGKTTTWNCKDVNGRIVSSGIYIVVAFDEEANEVGHAKFAVLRK